MIDQKYQDKLIIANCSGYLGDKLSAARELIEGGEIHVLTGDYLAELTMALLFRMKMKAPEKGYATTFLKQMNDVMGLCLDKNIKIVANAGGLNPKGLAEELEKIAGQLGISPKIACIEGDDLLPRIGELQEQGETFTHLDKGISLKEAGSMPITANAYLGGWGITKALTEGADIVVGGRLADAALVSGPSAWKFGWKEDDWDKMAGAYAAGHIIECGAQATGGNYSFFEEVPSFKNVGYPIAEMHEDGSFVITKHPGTGGLVSVGTVTAQLLYEIREPAYLTPDVKARFDTINISQQGADRVLISGVKGEPPTDSAKVCMNNLFGHRNSMTVVLTGLDIGKKAKIVEETIFDLLGGKDQFAFTDVQLIRIDKEDPLHNDVASAHLKISLIDPDQKKVGKLFSAKLVEMALSSIPGFTMTSPPSNGMPALQHWPTLVSNEFLEHKIFLNGSEFSVKPVGAYPDVTDIKPEEVGLVDIPKGNTEKIHFGRLFATRSGDKGGNANLGVWAKNIEAYSFLNRFLTVEKLKELLPDMDGFDMERYELPNLLAINFYIKGVLGEGVAASVRNDPQAKTLGEYLRAKVIEVPESIL
jgi:acyclic terpene utilization AtuA family protein